MPWESADGRVVEALASALKAINGVAPYHCTVKPTSVVTDPTGLLQVPPSEVPYLVIEAGPARWDGVFGRQRAVRARLRVTGRVDQPAREGRTRAALNLAEDIERAVGRDLTLGGTVVEALVGPPTIFVGPPPEVAAIVQVEVEALYVRAAAA